MEALIGGRLAKVLAEGRGRYNALFAAARKTWPLLDAEAFAGHVRAAVAPVAEAVADAAPARVEAAVDALYEVSLELCAKGLIGERSRVPGFGDAWAALLGAVAGLLAAAPRVVAPSLTNALYNLMVAPGVRWRAWTDDLRGLAPLCADAEALLGAGQVLAWRAGLAHFREGALDVSARLPTPVARAALGVAPGGAPPVDELVERLRRDPWLHPGRAAEAAEGGRALRLVAAVGGFRGFGGPFIRPPAVAVAEGRFLVSDGDEVWVLAADVFGATLRRTPGAAPPVPPSAKRLEAGEFTVDGEGGVSHDGERRVFPELLDPASAASDGTTLAVTVPLSHRVYLVAPAP